VSRYQKGKTNPDFTEARDGTRNQDYKYFCIIIVPSIFIKSSLQKVLKGLFSINSGAVQLSKKNFKYASK